MAEFMSAEGLLGGSARASAKGTTPAPPEGWAPAEELLGYQGRQEPSFLENLGGFLKEKAGETGAAAKSVGELLGAGIGMAAGAVAGTARTAEELVRGKPRREALQAGLETSGRVGAALNPVTVATKLLGYEPDKTVVDSVMDAMGKAIHHYGEKVEVGTNRMLLAEDIDTFAGLLMGAGMGKATVKGVAAATERAVAGKAAGTGMEDLGAPKVETQVGLPEPVVMTPEQLKAAFKSAKENRLPEVSDEAAVNSVFAKAKARGLAQVGPLAPEEAIAQSKTRIAEGLTLSEARKVREAQAAALNALPTDLERGIAKVRAGQGFLVTPEEKIAMDATYKAGNRIVGEDGKPLRAGFTEKGEVDPRLLTALGVSSAAVWAALAPEDQERLATTGVLGVTALAGHTRGSPLGALLKESAPYTFKTLEMLPKNAVEIGRQQITDLLKKPELQAERPVIERVLETLPEGKVNAHDLMSGVLEETAGWKLEPAETRQYADYGLNQIRNTSVGEPITTLYRLPEYMQLSDANHFGDSRLFGWTRSFVEDGIRHVVEVQSDLAQHAKGGVKPEDFPALVHKQDAIRKALNLFDEHQRQFDAHPLGDTTIPVLELYKAAERAGFTVDRSLGTKRVRDALELAYKENKIKLEATALDSQLSPILKNWPRRLIREELLKNKDQDVVRFASADTVAKVEGWPTKGRTEGQIAGDILHWEDVQKAAREGRTGPSGLRPDVALARAETRIADLKTELQEAQARKGQPPEFQMPGHQSIYNRYAGEITRYLKGLGGVEVRDAAGHTWWEVPTEAALNKVGRAATVGDGPSINMMGAADPKLLAGLAAGVALGAYVLNDGAKEGLMAAGLGAIGLRGKFKGVPESVLLDAIRAGGKDAQAAAAELYTQAAPRTLRMLEQKFGDKGLDLEGALQDGMIATLEGVANGTFRGDAKFTTYLHSAVVNKVLNQLDKIGRRGVHESLDVTPPEGTRALADTLGHEMTPEKIALNESLRGKLDLAMERLDPKFKEAFLAVEAEGLSYEEAAARFDVPVGTIRSRISRAKEGLQKSLRDYADEAKGPGFSQRGVVDTRTKAALAAISGGAVLNAYLNPEDRLWSGVKGAAYGLGAAVALANIKPRALLESWKRLQTSGPIVKIDDLIGQMTAQTKYGKLAVRQLATAIAKAVPDVTRREAIYDYLEGERSVALSAAERAAAEKARAFFDELGGLAKNSGVIPKLLENYVTRLYNKPTGEVLAGKLVSGEGKTSTPFSKPRAFKTRAEAEAAGYVPVTTDIARVLELYSDSTLRAVAGKQLVDTLRAVKEDGSALIEKAKKAPAGYVEVDHPSLRGMLVHPDIAPDLRFVFDQHEFGAVVAGLEAINNTQKRLGVSLSLFHATALEHALIGGVSVLKSPVLGAKAFGQSFLPMIFGESIVTKMLDSGGLHDVIKRGIDAGLEHSLDRLGKAAIEEENPHAAYRVLEGISTYLDKTIPGAGKYSVGALLELNHMFDQAMWGRFHTTLKVQTFLDKAAEISRNNARLVAKGKAELLSQAEVDKMAASFTNDLYGGLNYYKIANEFQSRWGRELAMQVVSPTGRLGMRLALFAPDWTISTTRAFVKGFGPQAGLVAAGAVAGAQLNTDTEFTKILGGLLGGALGLSAARAGGMKGQGGTGIMGALPAELGGRPANLVDLHRQYFLRSALIYTTLVDTVNYSMSGHHFWENKDRTRLDRGDGTTMQVSKHFMEPMHWLLDPRKQAMGKASFLVKESASQLGDVEYWSPHGAPRMGKTPKDQDVTLGTRVGHAGRQFLPISAQGMELGNPQKAGWSMLGMPVYGKTVEERAAAKEEARRGAVLRRIKKREDASK